MPETLSKQFLLPNTRQSIKPYVHEVTAFVTRHLPAHVNAAGINFKIEVILIELFTNSIKHAGTPETFLDVTVNGSILIQKKDFGNRFYPGNAPDQAYPIGSKKLLSRDGLHSMYAITEHDNLIRFVCEEIDDDIAVDVKNLIEHFGLLIITKSADSFTYQYDASTGLNTFSARIDL